MSREAGSSAARARARGAGFDNHRGCAGAPIRKVFPYNEFSFFKRLGAFEGGADQSALPAGTIANGCFGNSRGGLVAAPGEMPRGAKNAQIVTKHRFLVHGICVIFFAKAHCLRHPGLDLGASEIRPSFVGGGPSSSKVRGGSREFSDGQVRRGGGEDQGESSQQHRVPLPKRVAVRYIHKRAVCPAHGDWRRRDAEGAARATRPRGGAVFYGRARCEDLRVRRFLQNGTPIVARPATRIGVLVVGPSEGPRP